MSSENAEAVTPLALGVKKAAPFVGLSVSTLWSLIRQNKLPTRRIGSRRLILVSDLKAMLDHDVEIDQPAAKPKEDSPVVSKKKRPAARSSAARRGAR